MAGFFLWPIGNVIVAEWKYGGKPNWNAANSGLTLTIKAIEWKLSPGIKGSTGRGAYAVLGLS